MRHPQCGVIAMPDPVQLCPLDAEDKFIVIVSDGVHERALPLLCVFTRPTFVRRDYTTGNSRPH